MSPTARATLRQEPGESQGTSSAPGGEIGFPTTSAIGKLQLTALLRQAVESCHTQQKEAAIAQGYGTAYWSRIATGEKRAQLDPVANLSIDIQRAFLTAWAQQLGLTVLLEDPRAAAFEDLETAARRCLRLVELERALPPKAPMATAALPGGSR